MYICANCINAIVMQNKEDFSTHNYNEIGGRIYPPNDLIRSHFVDYRIFVPVRCVVLYLRANSINLQVPSIMYR